MASAMQIMAMLEGEALFGVYHDFQRKHTKDGSGLTIEEFVGSCLRHIPHVRRFLPPGKLDLVTQLRELFLQIDVNGDNEMEWSEFVGFCVEAGHMTTLSRLPPEPFSFEYDNFFVDQVTRHACTAIRQLTALPATNQIMSVEDSAQQLHFHSDDCRTTRSMDLTEGLRSIHHDGNVSFSIIEAVSIPEYELVALLLNDFSIPIWQHSRAKDIFAGTLPRARWVPHTLAWSAAADALFVGCRDGAVHAFDPRRRRALYTLHGHRDIVTDMLLIPSASILITASMDRQLIMWDYTHQLRKGHLTGFSGSARKLRWSPMHRRVVGIGIGGTPEGVGWDLHTSGLAFRMTGHRAELVDLQILSIHRFEGVITLDRLCEFRVWDIASNELGQAQCRKSFRIPPLAMTSPTCFVVLKSGDIIMASSRLRRFKFVRFQKANVPIIAMYNSVSQSFFTGGMDSFSEWSAVTGERIVEYRQVLSAEVTAACFDDRRRKFIIGMQSGAIHVYNNLSGALMKAAPRAHERDVTGLAYVPGDRCVVSVGWDRALRVWHEEPQSALTLLRSVANAHDGDIQCVTFAPSASLIITGGDDRKVRVWDWETINLVADFVKHPGSITDVATLDPLPVVLSCVSSGVVFGWSTRGSADPSTLLFRLTVRVHETILVPPPSESPSHSRNRPSSNDKKGASEKESGSPSGSSKTKKINRLTATELRRRMVQRQREGQLDGIRRFSQKKRMTLSPSGAAKSAADTPKGKEAQGGRWWEYVEFQGTYVARLVTQLLEVRQRRLMGDTSLDDDIANELYPPSEQDGNAGNGTFLTQTNSGDSAAPKRTRGRGTQRRRSLLLSYDPDEVRIREQRSKRPNLVPKRVDNPASLSCITVVPNENPDKGPDWLVLADEGGRVFVFDVTGLRREPGLEVIPKEKQRRYQPNYLALRQGTFPHPMRMVDAGVQTKQLSLSHRGDAESSARDLSPPVTHRAPSQTPVAVEPARGQQRSNSCIVPDSRFPDRTFQGATRLRSRVNPSRVGRRTTMATDDIGVHHRHARREAQEGNQRLPHRSVPWALGASTTDTPTMLDHSVPRAVRETLRFPAHEDAVISIGSVHDIGVQGVVTASADGRVRLWGLDGAMWGQLDTSSRDEEEFHRNPSKRPDWTMPLNRESHRDRDRAAAMATLRVVLPRVHRRPDMVLRSDTSRGADGKELNVTDTVGGSLDVVGTYDGDEDTEEEAIIMKRSTAKRPRGASAETEATEESQVQRNRSESKTLLALRQVQAVGTEAAPTEEMLPLDMVRSLQSDGVLERVAKSQSSGPAAQNEDDDILALSAFDQSRRNLRRTHSSSVLPGMTAVASSARILPVRMLRSDRDGHLVTADDGHADTHEKPPLYQHLFAEEQRLQRGGGSADGIGVHSLKHSRKVDTTPSAFLTKKLPSLRHPQKRQGNALPPDLRRKKTWSLDGGSRDEMKPPLSTLGGRFQALESDPQPSRAHPSMLPRPPGPTVLRFPATAGSKYAPPPPPPRSMRSMEALRLANLRQRTQSAEAPSSGSTEELFSNKGGKRVLPRLRSERRLRGLLPPPQGKPHILEMRDMLFGKNYWKTYRFDVKKGIVPRPRRRVSLWQERGARWAKASKPGRQSRRRSQRSVHESQGMPTHFGPYSAIEVVRIRRMFELIDTDNSGGIELDEMLSSPEWRQYYSEEQLSLMFAAMDKDQSGTITLDELLRVVFPLANPSNIRKMIECTAPEEEVVQPVAAPPKREERLTDEEQNEARLVFEVLDRDGDGFVTVDDLRDTLQSQTATPIPSWENADTESLVQRYKRPGHPGMDLRAFMRLIAVAYHGYDPGYEESPSSSPDVEESVHESSA